MNLVEYIDKITNENGSSVTIYRPNNHNVSSIDSGYIIFQFNDYNPSKGGVNIEIRKRSGCHSRSFSFKYKIYIESRVLFNGRWLDIDGEEIEVENEECYIDFDWNNIELEKRFSKTVIDIIKRIKNGFEN